MLNYSKETLISSNKQPLIEVHNISFNYGNLNVLKDITFKINKGDFFYIVGPNGAGKSTMIQLFTGIIKPTKGSIKINTNSIGYLPQLFTQKRQFPISIYETIYTGFKKQSLKISKDDYKLMDEWLVKMELENVGHKQLSELSGGQQQRVLLIRALISNPDLLILDEPTSALDKNFREKFESILNDCHKSGMTIIFVTHDLHDHNPNRYILTIDQVIESIKSTNDLGGHKHV